MSVAINNELTNKRILYQYVIGHCYRTLWSDLKEGVLLEISPSNKRIKIGDSWHNIGMVSVIEVLPNNNAGDI